MWVSWSQPRAAAADSSAVLARDLVILGGQAVIDRTLRGVTGRVAGWRAGRHTHVFPAEVAARGGGSPFARNLQRRLERRRKLAGG